MSKKTTTPNGPESFLSKLRVSLEEHRKALQSLHGVLLGEGYVVGYDGGYIRHVGGKTSFVNPTRANCYTREDATHIAACVVDGNGKNGKVQHLREALELRIQELEKLISLFS